MHFLDLIWTFDFAVSKCGLKILCFNPGWCGSVDWAPACKSKGGWFNAQSGHMPGLRDRQPHINVSLPLSPSFPFSLKLNYFLKLFNYFSLFSLENSLWAFLQKVTAIILVGSGVVPPTVKGPPSSHGCVAAPGSKTPGNPRPCQPEVTHLLSGLQKHCAHKKAPFPFCERVRWWLGTF